MEINGLAWSTKHFFIDLIKEYLLKLVEVELVVQLAGIQIDYLVLY